MNNLYKFIKNEAKKKITLITALCTTLVTFFYMYNGKLQAPGGSSHFFRWAEITDCP